MSTMRATNDTYAAAVQQRSTGDIVGHIPQMICVACSPFFEEKQHHSLYGYREQAFLSRPAGLEVPSKLIFLSKVKYVENMKRLLMPASCEPEEQHAKRSKVIFDDVVTADDRESVATQITWLSLNKYT